MAYSIYDMIIENYKIKTSLKNIHMKTIFLKSLLFIFCIYNVNLLSAQNKKQVKGTIQIKVESNQSKNDAKEMAIEQAKIKALTDEFGQYVEQENTALIEQGRVDFRSYGQTKVKGEWLKTIGEPKFDYNTRTNDGIPEVYITCTIKGMARKALPKANVEIEILSCPEVNCRTYEFKSGENMYLMFKSPIKGFLSVFLDDGATVYRLFPYRSMENTKAVQINEDEEYILFSNETNRFESSADQLVLFTYNSIEKNRIIVIFSEHEYNKPMLEKESLDPNKQIIPKSLSKAKFENWLGENRATFDDFLDISKTVIIKKE